ncbi:MAG: chlorhexidine efflux transporter [Marinomonadaceae bacterium]
MVRVLHSLIFELGLLTINLPIMACWLNISLVSVFAQGMEIVAFYLVYAFFYNFVYDYDFPIPPKKS